MTVSHTRCLLILLPKLYNTQRTTLFVCARKRVLSIRKRLKTRSASLRNNNYFFFFLSFWFRSIQHTFIPFVIFPTRCNFTQFIISGKLLYMFRVVSSPIIRNTHNCIYSIWYLLTVTATCIY